jgi:transcriptional regulator with XRE-family HTH domain
MEFGVHIKARRLEMGLSLRAFCMRYGEDPSNWSKIERGLAPPPESYARILQIGLYLGYAEDSPAMADLFDLASLSRGTIPQDIREDKALMAKLPLVFRTLRDGPTESELMQLADLIREAQTPDVS